ncbi:dephospho-CoA kinase [Salegentibacter salarius]|uniref:Dephospho-CoA kinase n=1 Tax=Salegentibacter salarius TaxID=435906 RepID=A0A2N0TXP5_9FLAO|nr:dephospho-CoA kinase [Salegentibacter salarius]OEY73185.1 dephospho-CoA kinase [Salegentibacter salarius]PKD19517.1 dephospho-CoA kinase [Salegentibacter salarius]SLJ98859.1 dephospho-CoA kinase [Salegentibacter salarius]
MMVVGLTGGIGSGKTTVAGFFKEKGVPVYIADDAGKRLLETSAEIREKVIALIGEKAYTGKSPNRKHIASVVFKESDKLDALNKIIHPAVAKDFENWQSKQNSAYVLYEAAILFEAGGYKKCDLNILVTASKEEKLKRLQKRDQSTLEEIEARMAKQWSDERKKKLADFEIENHDLALTRTRVDELHEIILKRGKN